MKPPKDHKVQRPNGPWTPAIQTDILKTFAKLRRRADKLLREQAGCIEFDSWATGPATVQPVNVRAIRRRV